MNKTDAIIKIITQDVDANSFPVAQFHVALVGEIPMVLLHFSNPDLAVINDVYYHFLTKLRNYVDGKVMVIHATTTKSFCDRRLLMFTRPEEILRIANLYISNEGI